MFVGALIACFPLDRLDRSFTKVEQKQRGGRVGWIARIRTRNFEEQSSGEVFVIPKEDYADDNSDDVGDDERVDDECNTNEIKKKRKTRTSDNEYQKNIENRAKATSRMNEHTREQVIESSSRRRSMKTRRSTTRRCLKVYRPQRNRSEKSGSEERRVVQPSVKPPPTLL